MRGEYYIPIELVSCANLSEFWADKKKRNDKQGEIVRYILNPNISKFMIPIKITLCRIAPRKLDEEDNLRMAFKSLKDHIADIFIPGLPPGRADGNKSIEWAYDQESRKPREYGVLIKIEEKSPETKNL